MRRLWPFVRAHRRTLAAAAVLFPVASAVDLVPPYLIKVAIDDHIVTGHWRGLTAVALLLALTVAAQYALRFSLGYLLAWTGQSVVHDLRQALFAQALERVGRGARLVNTAAQCVDRSRGKAAGNRFHLSSIFNGTGAADNQ